MSNVNLMFMYNIQNYGQLSNFFLFLWHDNYGEEKEFPHKEDR